MRNARVVTVSMFLAFVVGAIAVSPAATRAIDVSGSWTLTVVAPNPGCQFTGQMDVIPQSGSSFTGSATLTLVPGSNQSCPPSFSGTASGSLSGNDIVFGIADLSIGTVNFAGTVAGDGLSASGTWTSTNLGEGTWGAIRVPEQVAAICGSLTLDASAPNQNCTLTGPMTLTPDGSELRGVVSLRLLSGQPPCPLNASANVIGAVYGSEIRLVLVIPEQGCALFEGALSPDQRSMSGTWTFPGEANASGTWDAACSGVAAPALGTEAIGLLGLLLLAGGRSVLRRSA